MRFSHQHLHDTCMTLSTEKNLPGTLWLNRGRWNWRVRLPGSPARENYPLRLPGQSVALSEEKGRSLAVSIAWRLWERASKPAARGKAGKTLDEVVSGFLGHAETYYRRSDGTATREAANCEIALRSLRAKYGAAPIDDLTYQRVLSARDELIASGLNRTTINQRVGIWRRFAAWALENRLMEPATKVEIWALSPLKRGRSQAPEGEPVRPVRHLDVKRTIRFMPPNLQAMVKVQELCGARPAEVCDMRPCDIEKKRGWWVYRPAKHKTAHKDNVRVIVLGPRAQKELTPWLAGGDPGRRVFYPERGGGDSWTASNYGQAVRYAIRAARKAGVAVSDWTPNQLRHACGTRARRKFGIEVAASVLGHARQSRVTDTYTRQAIERELIRSASVAMLAIG